MRATFNTTFFIQRTRCNIKTKSSHFRDIGSGTAFFDENMHGMLTKERHGVANSLTYRR